MTVGQRPDRPATAGLTSEQQASLDALRAALPPIHDYDPTQPLPRVFGGDELTTIDCEWHNEKCKCGRDLPNGMLETVGVGNEKRVVQIDWIALGDNDYQKHEVQFGLLELVRAVPIVYQFAINDIKKLREFGFKIHPSDHLQLEDVGLADAVINAEEDHDLGSLNERHGKLPNYKDLMKLAPREYNAADCVAPVLLWKHYYAKEFAKDPAAEAVYRDESLAYLKELQLEQEEHGIRVDLSRPYPLKDKYEAKIEQATKLARAYAGWPINLRSSNDLKHQLYTVEGLPPQYEKGPPQAAKKVTTDKDAVAALRRWHGTEFDADTEPTLDLAWENINAGGHPLLEARYLLMGAAQSLSHYLAPAFVLGPKGEVLGIRDRLYPEVRIHVQASGRHSYTGPALQQFRGELLELITPDPGTIWLSFDYAQIEVRLLAALAHDEPYLAAFANGEDIHERNVRTIFGPKGTPELEVLRRRFTKAFVFRLHYRGKPENAGDIPGTKVLGLNGPKLVAASENYMAGHQAIIDYWSVVEKQAETYGVVYTFMGRPRRLTSQFKNARIREACNHPVQGGVSDIYIETALMVKRAAPWARLVYGAHDAQTWQVATERKDEFRALIEPIVQRPFVVNGVEITFPAEFKKERQAA